MTTALNIELPETMAIGEFCQPYQTLTVQKEGSQMNSRKTNPRSRRSASVAAFIAIIISLFCAAMSHAASPRMVNLQAELVDPSGAPYVSTTVDLTLRIYDAGPSGTGTLIWTETQTGVATDAKGVVNVMMGSVVPLTPAEFVDAMRYLEIQVNSDPPMSPRIRLLSVPYALYSTKVTTLDGALGGLISGDVSVTNDLHVQNDAEVFGSLSTKGFEMSTGATDGYVLTCDASGNATWSAPSTASGGYWSLTGNSGLSGSSNFLGTTDGIPLSFRVDDKRVLRISPGGDNSFMWYDETSPNFIGGNEHNSMATGINGAVIGGGGVYDAPNSVDGHNEVTADFGTISGGLGNKAGEEASVGGGEGNKATGRNSAIPGGSLNKTQGYAAFAVGSGNEGRGTESIAMGKDCIAGGDNSTALGIDASVTHTNSFLWSNEAANSTADNQFKVRASGGVILSTDNGVCINCNDAGSFDLAVDGKVGAREIVVTASDPWPDYVFDESYALTPLSDLEKDLQQAKHLPGMPSAATVAEDGVSVGDMQSRLLRKVEELTLYIIQIEKEKNALADRLDRIESGHLTPKYHLLKSVQNTAVTN